MDLCSYLMPAMQEESDALHPRKGAKFFQRNAWLMIKNSSWLGLYFFSIKSKFPS